MNRSLSELSYPPGIQILNYLPTVGTDTLVRQILAGLCSKQMAIPSMFFYDAAGSRLFEAITRLPEYYLTRTEKALIKEAAEALGDLLSDVDIVEIGSGDCSKISLLLQDLTPTARGSIRYLPLDVSESAIRKSAETLSRLYPEVTIHGFVADFLSQLNVIPGGQRKLFCFFGSTIGNLSRTQGVLFIRDISRIMEPGDHLLLGMDRVKDVKIVEAAYNDSQQVTAAFNRNILNVVNTYTGSDFDPELFEHLAFYQPDQSRIEMHLKASYDMVVHCPRLKRELYLLNGDTIHTEDSHKFTNGDIAALSRASGLDIVHQWTDAKQWFTLVQFGKG